MICEKFSAQYPNVHIAGSWSPPFKPAFDEADSRAMITAVNRAAPHVLWVGMTAPKQEKWIHRHRASLNADFIGAIGAVFDFYIGTVKRSHPWFQERGLEWLPRLLREPRRLWNRTLVSAPIFLRLVLRQRLAQPQNGKVAKRR
jgi:N-acetylglucosaminyldiphosphoundecaprenol N-acetyl-beta-D-mannosaminyltransferase